MDTTELVWTTKDGREIPLPEMSDRHLENAHRWADRNADHLLMMAADALAYAGDAPDGAAMCAEAEADRMFRQGDILRNWSRAFQLELERRKET